MPRPRRKRRNAVFVEDFVDLPCPITDIPQQLLGSAAWLTRLANAAEDDGETLRLRIGPTWVGGRIKREVEVRVIGARAREAAVVVSLSWESVRHTSLFPVLEGDLELAPIGGGLCRLTLSATYVPPFGELGRALDIAVLHRVGQSTARSFLQRLATSITDASGSDRRLEPLVEYLRDLRPSDVPLGLVPLRMHLAYPGDDRALCGHIRSATDRVGPYIFDYNLQCSSCWSALE